MIELSSTTALMLYLGTTLTFLFGIWSYHHYASRNKKIIPLAHELSVCEYCHFVYLHERKKHITQCPQCHSYNKNGEF